MSFIFWSDVFAVVKAVDGETEVPAGSAAVHLGECKCDALCLQELLITLERNNSDFKSPWQHNFYLKAKLRKRGEVGGGRGGWGVVAGGGERKQRDADEEPQPQVRLMKEQPEYVQFIHWLSIIIYISYISFNISKKSSNTCS